MLDSGATDPVAVVTVDSEATDPGAVVCWTVELLTQGQLCVGQWSY